MVPGHNTPRGFAQTPVKRPHADLQTRSVTRNCERRSIRIDEAFAVRTKIEIDDALLAEAMAATGLRTKRSVVEAGLRLLARQKRQADARELFGRIRWEGDPDRERLTARPISDPKRGR